MDPGAPPTAEVTPRRHRRIAAMTAALASALWLASYFFLPWLTFAPAQRQRVREAFQPAIDTLAERSPERAERYRALLRRIVDHGSLSGVDLNRYATLAYETNRELQGDPPAGSALERPWVVQRAWPTVARLLAALAAACAILLVSLV